MITLILAFFVLAPYIVLYTVGWRYNWSSHQLLGTGVINVDVQPRTARTYINDVLVGEQQPLRLASRAPGLYRLRIEAPGYRDWNQNLTVVSHQTTFVSEIQLYRASEPTRIYDTERDILATYPGNQTQYLLALQATGNGYQVGYLNANNTLVIATSTNRPEIHISPDRTSALVITDTTLGSRLQLAHLNSPDTRLLGWQTSTVAWQWAPSEDADVIIKKGTQLVRQNFISSADSIVQSTTATLWFYDADDRLWTATDHRLFVDSVLAADTTEPITKILDVNKNRALVLHNTSISSITINKQGISTDQTNRRLTNYRSTNQNTWIAWSGTELWTFYANGSSQLLVRSSEAIQDAVELTELGVIAIAYPTGIEFLNPGYFVTDRLANVETVERIEANQHERILYLVGRYRSQPGLYKLEY